jgi:hydroxyacylglutathione hydrolase
MSMGRADATGRPAAEFKNRGIRPPAVPKNRSKRMHCVTQPTPPFISEDRKLRIHQVPADQDNLIWLVEYARGKCAAIDGPSAVEALAYCQRMGLTLTTILNTHVHGDHIGINLDLQKRGMLEKTRVVGGRSTARQVPGITEAVMDGDSVWLGQCEGKAMLTEGHIDGHISYLFSDVLFCGDTLFGGGCGYLFDGPPGKMYRSLKRLAELPEDTRICCAHEYTEDNLRFALSVEPNNQELVSRTEKVLEIRSRGGCTLPSTIGIERKTNPFLRHHSAELQEKVWAEYPAEDLSAPERLFTAARRLKDSKAYKETPWPPAGMAPS